MDRKAILLLSRLSVEHRAHAIDFNALYAVRAGRCDGRRSDSHDGHNGLRLVGLRIRGNIPEVSACNVNVVYDGRRALDADFAQICERTRGVVAAVTPAMPKSYVV
jgi:hypothetical protein